MAILFSKTFILQAIKPGTRRLRHPLMETVGTTFTGLNHNTQMISFLYRPTIHQGFPLNLSMIDLVSRLWMTVYLETCRVYQKNREAGSQSRYVQSHLLFYWKGRLRKVQDKLNYGCHSTSFCVNNHEDTFDSPSFFYPTSKTIQSSSWDRVLYSLSRSHFSPPFANILQRHIKSFEGFLKEPFQQSKGGQSESLRPLRVETSQSMIFRYVEGKFSQNSTSS